MLVQIAIENHQEKKSIRSRKMFLLASALLLVAIFGQNGSAHMQSGSSSSAERRLSRLAFAQSGGEADAAAKSFREGRDLIEEENWEAAEKHFKEFIADNPRHKNADAALYWLAFALKKQGNFRDADRTLERLIKSYAKSEWKDDAQAMRIEIAPQLGDQTPINQALDGGRASGDEEMKMIALQSLLHSNPDRALPILQDLLKPESKASKNLKQTAVALIGQSGARGISTLLEVARNNRDNDLRRTAMVWLGLSGDDRAFEYLREMITQGSDKELLDSAVVAVAQSRNPKARALLSEIVRSNGSLEMRKAAIIQLALFGGDSAFDELSALYNSESNVELKKQLLTAFSMSGGARAKAKIEEVARNETNTELRKTALFWFGQRGGEATLDTLMQIYDSEPSHEVKEHLLFVMAQSGNKKALQKLMQIAKTSPSGELRKRAVFWLGQSQDPEARKFIEDILK
jgi:TolA-binding protein